MVAASWLRVATYIVRLCAKLSELGVTAEIVNRPRRGYALVFKEHGELNGQVTGP